MLVGSIKPKMTTYCFIFLVSPSIDIWYGLIQNKKMASEIRFRELCMEDVNELFKIYSDKEAMKFRGSKPMENIEEAKKYVENKKLLKGDILTFRKGVELEKTKELIGSVMYRFNEDRKNECEIGYSIGRRFWGQGLGKEIVNTLLKTIEEQQSIDTVVAWSNKENIASIKILEKIGFIRIEQDESQMINLYKFFI